MQIIKDLSKVSTYNIYLEIFQYELKVSSCNRIQDPQGPQNDGINIDFPY